MASYKDIAAAASAQSNPKPSQVPSSSPSLKGDPKDTSPKPSAEPSGGTKDQTEPKTPAPEESTAVKNESTAPTDKVTDTEKSRGNGGGKDGNSTAGTASPSQSSSSIPQVFPPHGTPQQGYYVAYNNAQVTPEPPSPHTTGAIVYDVGSFFQQASGFHNSPFTTGPPHPYGAAASGQPQPPACPNSQSIPPASPLFPRVTNPATAALLGATRAELSPGPQYVSSGGSTEDFTAWNDSRYVHLIR